MTVNRQAREATDTLGQKISDILDVTVDIIRKTAHEYKHEIPQICLDIHLQATATGIDEDDNQTRANVVMSDDPTGIDAIMMGMRMFSETMKSINDDAKSVTQEDAVRLMDILEENGTDAERLNKLCTRLEMMLQLLHSGANLKISSIVSEALERATKH